MQATPSRPTVILLSSDRRRRYAEDVLTTLALPERALIQFRYGSDYVAPSLQQRVANGTVIGERSLLAFVANMDSDLPFVLPVRFAKIVRAESVADIFIFRLSVEAFAHLEGFPLAEHDIRTESKRLLDKLRELNGKSYYPATSKFPDFQVAHEGDSAQLWLGAVERLAQHPTFAESYFVRIDVPVRQSGKGLDFDDDGRLALVDQQSAKVPVSFFSKGYSEVGRKVLTCTTDGTFVRVSSDDQYDVALRYDTVEFWLQPAATTFDALARITIRLGHELETHESPPATIVRFPVIIRRSRSRLAFRIGSGAIGAFMVALPAILGEESPLNLRVTLAMIGAALLAIGTIVAARQ